jgi:hypothetical protein
LTKAAIALDARADGFGELLRAIGKSGPGAAKPTAVAACPVSFGERQ